MEFGKDLAIGNRRFAIYLMWIKGGDKRFDLYTYRVDPVLAAEAHEYVEDVWLDFWGIVWTPGECSNPLCGKKGWHIEH